jgi:rubrerythrin
MYTNDIRALNYALIAEQLEAAFYNQYVSKYNSSDYTRNGFADASKYLIVVREHENAHVQYLRMTITQRKGTPVPVCSYNFTVNNVSQFIQTAGALENTGVKAYNGAIGTISDPDLILAAATVATVEARHAAYLNQLQNLVPFPNTTDETLTPTQVAAALTAFQTCSFTPDLPVILNPSTFTPSG